jgi:hypothetical protein
MNKEGFRSQEVSQYLEVEARTAPCRLCILDMHGKEQVGISLSLGNGWDVVAEIYWDSPPDKGKETVLKAILLPGANSTQTSVDMLYAHVLILKQHLQHYERVGIARLPATFGNDGVIYQNWNFYLKYEFGNLYYDDQDPDIYSEQKFAIARKDVPQL